MVYLKVYTYSSRSISFRTAFQTTPWSAPASTTRAARDGGAGGGGATHGEAPANEAIGEFERSIMGFHGVLAIYPILKIPFKDGIAMDSLYSMGITRDKSTSQTCRDFLWPFSVDGIALGIS